ncbi:skin secretory protein xP2-like [Cydia pomonella]|uniref:skin secretory protein xP2-like n=1 Tax=Cydia pomonella TaxID=82600 RepID=UPI002ADE5B11|nr:skin secretory protein xP2-like [Cydia pomonella]XP_061729492.1 skin secretory protein xP2-like [Cydia pomonella]
MTSVPFNVGLGDDNRLSSRVLRPPGGGHTDIFGGDPEPPRGRRQNPAAAYATSLGEHQQPQNGNAPAQNGQGQEAPAPAPTPEAAPKTEAPAAEPAQPEPVKPAQPAAAAEPPKRVRVPPGGFSSGLW